MGVERDVAEIDIHEGNKKLAKDLNDIAEARTEKTKKDEEIAKCLGGVPYERERVIGEILVYLKQTAQGIIEAGKRLIAIKKAEKHGEWEKIVRERLKIAPVTAWRFMGIARKSQIFHGVKDLTVTYDKGIGKMYALLSLPDEELIEFEETGLLKGKTIDDINQMSVSAFKRLLLDKEKLESRNKQLELEMGAKYDTSKQYKEKLGKKDQEIEKLKEEVKEAKAGLPEDVRKALKEVENLKLQFKGQFRIIENSEPKNFPDEVRQAVCRMAMYVVDRANLMQSRILSNWNFPGAMPPSPAEQELLEKKIMDEWGEDAD